MEYDSATAAYLQNLGKAAGLYTLALRSQLGLLDAYYNSLLTLYDAERGALMFTDAAAAGFLLYGGLPVVTMAGVFVALGSGYAAAREAVQNENDRIGFAEGFVMGLLGWSGSQVKYLFGRFGVLRIYQADEELNSIRVKAYNAALAAGYTAAKALPKAAQKEYLSKLRKLAGHPSAGNWTRNDQISFVIDLATTALKKGVIQR
jgi:hypothetical protein